MNPAAAAFRAYQLGSILPRSALHPSLSEARKPFLHGQYDLAVFQAFRQVEVAVRRVGKFKNSDLGVSLMRDAFHADRGPLRDLTPGIDRGELEACAHLFAGAIGLFKNPVSHRIVDFNSPVVSAEMIMLASLLLRIIDQRGARP